MSIEIDDTTPSMLWSQTQVRMRRPLLQAVRSARVHLLRLEIESGCRASARIDGGWLREVRPHARSERIGHLRRARPTTEVPRHRAPGRQD